MTDSQKSERRRPPWFLIIAAILIVVAAIVIAIVARGQAVDDVARGAQPHAQPIAEVATVTD